MTTMSIALQGVFAPVVTPFTADGALDVAAFRANVRAHIAAGLSGVVVTGSTGEAALVDDAERRTLLEAARADVPADKLLIAATGAESTRKVIERNADAARIGADAVMVVAPHYYTSAMTHEALRAHYLAVADASAVPVLLYNIPKYTHFALPPALIAELSEHPRIHGMKDSSGDLALIAEYLRSQDDAFTVLTGSGQTLAEAMALGAHGGILGVSLFAPELSLATYEAASRGARDEAAVLQARLFPLAKEIVGTMGVPGVKAALTHVGLRGGVPRLPLLPAPPADVARIAELISASGAGVPA
jgi:4-hydroxy-2-oxoglutarate aldolase